LMNWYYLADLGMGYVTQNKISELTARKQDVVPYLASVGRFAIGLTLLLIALEILLYQVKLDVLFGSNESLPRAELAELILVTGILFILNGVGQIGYKVLYARKLGHVANVLPALGYCIGLGLVWWLFESRPGIGFSSAVIPFFIPIALAATGSVIWMLGPQIFVKEGVGIFSLMQNLKVSSKFWLIYLFNAVVVNLDLIIIYNLLSARDVVVYSILTRLFAFSGFFYVSVYQLQWPIISEGMVTGETDRVIKTLKRTTLFSVGSVLVFCLAVLLLDSLILQVLAPDKNFTFPLELVLTFGLYHFVVALLFGFGIVLQSRNELNPLLFATLVQAVILVVMLWLLVPKLGLIAGPLSLLCSNLLTMGWMLPRSAFRLIRSVGRESR
jgi:O-antigen/teichoic acid export membrane protein